MRYLVHSNLISFICLNLVKTQIYDRPFSAASWTSDIAFLVLHLHKDIELKPLWHQSPTATNLANQQSLTWWFYTVVCFCHKASASLIRPVMLKKKKWLDSVLKYLSFWPRRLLFEIPCNKSKWTLPHMAKSNKSDILNIFPMDMEGR